MIVLSSLILLVLPIFGLWQLYSMGMLNPEKIKSLPASEFYYMVDLIKDDKVSSVFVGRMQNMSHEWNDLLLLLKSSLQTLKKYPSVFNTQKRTIAIATVLVPIFAIRLTDGTFKYTSLNNGFSKKVQNALDLCNGKGVPVTNFLNKKDAPNRLLDIALAVVIIGIVAFFTYIQMHAHS